MSLMDELRDDVLLVGASLDDAAGNLNPLDPRFLTGTAPTTASMAEIQNAAAEGRDYSPERARLSSGQLTPEERAYADARGIGTGLSVVGTAARDTAGQALDTVEQKVSQVSTLLEWLSKPWVLGGLALIVGLAVAAPYIAPFLKRS